MEANGSGDSRQQSDFQALRAFCEAFISSFDITEETASNVTAARIGEIASVSDSHYAIIQHLAVEGEHICSVLQSQSDVSDSPSESERISVSHIVHLVRLHLPHIKEYFSSIEKVQDNEVSSSDGPPPVSAVLTDGAGSVPPFCQGDPGDNLGKSSLSTTSTSTSSVSSGEGNAVGKEVAEMQSSHPVSSHGPITPASTIFQAQLPPPNPAVLELVNQSFLYGDSRDKDVRHLIAVDSSSSKQTLAMPPNLSRTTHSTLTSTNTCISSQSPIASIPSFETIEQIPHPLSSSSTVLPSQAPFVGLFQPSSLVSLSIMSPSFGPKVFPDNHSLPRGIATLQTSLGQSPPTGRARIVGQPLILRKNPVPMSAPRPSASQEICAYSPLAPPAPIPTHPASHRGTFQTQPPVLPVRMSMPPKQNRIYPSVGFQSLQEYKSQLMTTRQVSGSVFMPSPVANTLSTNPMPHAHKQVTGRSLSTAPSMVSVLPTPQMVHSQSSTQPSAVRLPTGGDAAASHVQTGSELNLPTGSVLNVPTGSVLNVPTGSVPIVPTEIRPRIPQGGDFNLPTDSIPPGSRLSLPTGNGLSTSTGSRLGTLTGSAFSTVAVSSLSTGPGVKKYSTANTSHSQDEVKVLSQGTQFTSSQTSVNKASKTSVSSLTNTDLGSSRIGVARSTTPPPSLSSSCSASLHSSQGGLRQSTEVNQNHSQNMTSGDYHTDEAPAGGDMELTERGGLGGNVLSSFKEERPGSAVLSFNGGNSKKFLFKLLEEFFFPSLTFDSSKDASRAVDATKSQQPLCRSGSPLSRDSKSSSPNDVSTVDPTPGGVHPALVVRDTLCSVDDCDQLSDGTKGQQKMGSGSARSSRVHEIPDPGTLVLAKFGQGEQSSWKEAVVTSHKAGKRKGERKFVVNTNGKFHDKEHHRLAMVRTAVVSEVTAKTRIIAEYGAMGYLFSGVVAEPPVRENGHRALVFFDDGFAQYVTLDKIHLTYQKTIALDKQYSSMHQFLRSYFSCYPKHLKLKVKKGDILDVERHGDILKAEVEQIDCSLMKLKFVEQSEKVVYEWLYRGNFRLIAIYEESQRRKGKSPPSITTVSEDMFTDDMFDPCCPPLKTTSDNTGIHFSQSSVGSLASPDNPPFMDLGGGEDPSGRLHPSAVTEEREEFQKHDDHGEWLVSSHPSDSDSSIKIVLQRKRMQLHDDKGLPRKRAKSVSTSRPSTDSDGDFEENHSSLESVRLAAPRRSLSAGDNESYLLHQQHQVRSQPHSSSSRSQSPNTPLSEDFTNYYHTCSEDCKGTAVLPANYLLYHSLAFPLMLNWTRSIENVCRKGGNRKPLCHIYYVAPCKKRLRNIGEVKNLLSVMKEERLAVDMFCFDATINISLSPMERSENALYYDQDLSCGQELVPIPCVNELDSSGPPPFEYIKARKWSEGLAPETSHEFMLSCSCTDSCQDPNMCSCLKLTMDEFQLIKPNDLINPTRREKLGYHFNRLTTEKITALYECNQHCSCSRTCGNRVIQGGLMPRMEVFKTPDRGWGVRCLDDIPQGTFVAHYCGMVLSDTAAEELAKKSSHTDAYLVDLDYVEVVEHHKTHYYASDYENLEAAYLFESTLLGDMPSPSSDNDRTWEELQEVRDEVLAARSDLPKTRNRSRRPAGHKTAVDSSLKEDSATNSPSGTPMEVTENVPSRQTTADLGATEQPERDTHQPTVTQQLERDTQQPTVTQQLEGDTHQPTVAESQGDVSTEDDDDLPVFDLTNLSSRCEAVEPFVSVTSAASDDRKPSTSTSTDIPVKQESQYALAPCCNKSKPPEKQLSIKVEPDQIVEQSPCSIGQATKSSCRDNRGSKLSCGSRDDPICLSDSDDSVFGEENSRNFPKSPNSLNSSLIGASLSNRTSANASIDTRSSPDQHKLFTIDASLCGNVARFFNHSCCPNMFVKNIFVDSQDCRFTWVALFTRYNVKARTELTWDYNYTPDSIQGRRIECKCGASNCRGRLL